MSYDIELGVRVEGARDIIVYVGEPELSSPTYNLGTMFRECTGWDFEQSRWYKVSEVLPLIKHGIIELETNEEKYKKYNAKNGWGNTQNALESLVSLDRCIEDFVKDGIPAECLYVRW